MLLAELVINSTTYYLSDEGVDPEYDWTHNWRQFIVSMDPPTYKADHGYGGLVRVNYGSIGISQEFFTGWPYPKNFQITLYITDSNDSAKSLIFSGTAHAKELNDYAVIYDLYDKNLSYNLLAEATDYNSATVPLPRAFGKVVHAVPVRIPDVSGRPTYHKGYITSTLARPFTAVSNNGSGRCRFACSAHGFSTGNSVTIEGTNRIYNGTYSITVVDANTFDVTTLNYSVTTTGHAFKAGYWSIYDDGVPISANVIDNGASFSLTATPAGEVTISGTGHVATLSQAIVWACGASYFNLTADTSLWNSSIPEMSYWATSQRKLTDFISDLCAWYCHLCFMSATTCYLVDVFTDNGSASLTEYAFFRVSYREEPPVGLVRAQWAEKRAVEETIGKYVKEESKETYLSSSYPYGNEISIEPFCSNKADIESCLTRLLTAIHMTTIELSIPLEGSPPVPGKRYSWTDTSKGQQNISGYMRVIGIRHELLSNKPCYLLTGNGAIS